METLSFKEPFTSTSRAVFALPYLEEDAEEEEEDSYPASRGRELYEEAWELCSQRIQTTLSGLHDASLDQIVSFVQASPSPESQLYATLSALQPLKTGLIIGAAPGSSSLLFSALCKQLSSSNTLAKGKDKARVGSTCLISRIASRDCPTIKGCLRSIIAGFLGSGLDEVDLEEEEEGADLLFNTSKGKAASTMAPEDLTNLKVWYQWRYGKREPEERPRLVLLLEDLEAMDGKVLVQMIETLSPYAETLDLVLLVGIATSSNALHEVVPRSATNLLEISSFFVEPGVRAFNALIKGVFFDWTPPLGLGAEVYQFIWKAFIEQNHSADAAVSAIQYLYMDHFSKNSYAISTWASPPDVSHLCEEPDLLRELESVETEVFDNPNSAFARGMCSSNKAFGEQILRSMEERNEWQKGRKLGLEVLQTLQTFFNSKKTVEATFLEIETGTIQDHVKELCKFVSHTTSLKLDNVLSSLAERIEALMLADPDIPPTFLSKLSAHASELEKLLKVPLTGRTNLINLNVFASDEMYKGAITSTDKEFSKLCAKVGKEIQKDMWNAFRSYFDLHLHELFFVSDPTPLASFHPSMLPSFHSSLQSAQDYTASSSKPGAGLDIAYAYKSFQEANSRVINLGDMYVQFEANAADEKRKGKGKKRAEIDGEDEEEEEERTRRKQARFLRALGDLAHTGYLGPNTRKVEHVTKTVFYPEKSRAVG